MIIMTLAQMVIVGTPLGYSHHHSNIFLYFPFLACLRSWSENPQGWIFTGQYAVTRLQHVSIVSSIFFYPSLGGTE